MTTLTHDTCTLERLTIDDLPRCLGHAEAHYNALKINGTFDQAHFLKTWENLYRYGIGEVLALMKDGKDIGGMGMLIAPDQCNPALIATLFWIFVDEEHRGGSAALRLLREAERWAWQHGAKILRMSYHVWNSPYQADPLASPWAGVFRRMGLQPMDMLWQKPLDFLIEGGDPCQFLQ